MRRNRFRAFLLAAFAPALALLGCDLGISQLKPGVSTAADVRKVLGEPAFEWREPDGGYTWEFPRGPTGVVTYMVDMAPDHKLKAVRQVLTDDYFAKIERGMPREAVRRLVGRPGETMLFPNLQEDVWTWRYEIGSNDVWFFHVHFGVDGAVKRTSRNKFDENP
ncbi:MAG: hypothetical protein ACREVP_09875 [Burkholderiales bacterium]